MKALLLLSPQDYCLIACRDLAQGSTVEFAGQHFTLTQTVPTGYKVARCAIAAGEKVLRYGASIGSAVQPIAAGEMIHTHNLQSDYLPTYLRESGAGSKSFVSQENAND